MEKIHINGYIESESYWEDSTSLSSIQNTLDTTTENEIHLVINSTGGDAFAGLQICDAVVAWKLAGENRTVKATVVGHCMSAASLVLMSADTIEAYPHAQFMIHQASTMVWGNKQEMKEAIDLLDQIDNQIKNLYLTYRGLDIENNEEAKALFENDTIFTAEKAQAIGLIDKVLDLSPQEKVNDKSKLSAISNYLNSEKRMDFLAKMKNAFSRHNIKNEGDPVTVTNVAHSLEDGTLLHSTDESLAEGSMVYTDEGMTTAAPDGSHTLADGRVITVAGGSITSIAAATENVENSTELAKKVADLAAVVENLNQTVNSLKSENETLKTENQNQKAFITEVQQFYNEATQSEKTKKPVSVTNNRSTTAANDRDEWFRRATGRRN